jgi:hypothetical protein
MLGNSITVINKSGRVVSNTKHLTGVWKEAKAAYQSKKAEIKANRDTEFNEQHARRALKNVSLSDEHLPRKTASRAGSSRSVTRSKTGGHRKRSSVQHEHDRHHGQHDHRGHPEHSSRRRAESIQHGESSSRRRPEPLQRGYTDSAFGGETVYSHPDLPPAFDAPKRDHELVRRKTMPLPRNSASSLDEHLAYGNLPPNMPPLKPEDTEIELRGKMTVLEKMLEEANCLQYSATSMIEHLQKNPEALAAVGLTLAEISTLARKVGPIALGNMKTMFPAVIALLASPQFLIAGGVAVGVTVVMLGGYKIVKKVREKKALEAATEMDELREIESEISGIELWRRGIADQQAESVAISVEGEFITPGASQRLMDDGVMKESDLKPKSVHRAKSTRSHRSERTAGGHRRSGSVRSHDDTRSERTSGTKRRSTHHHIARSRADDEVSKSGSVKDSKAKRAVGGLRLLFKGKSAPQ